MSRVTRLNLELVSVRRPSVHPTTNLKSLNKTQHTHTRQTDRFNGLFSRTSWVSRTRKVKPIWILMKHEMVWQWHQLDHVQIICTLFQTDNHASTSSLNFYRPNALPDPFHRCKSTYKNSSGDEIANVNFYAVRPELPEFSEITQNNGHYAVQGHSRSPILVPIGSSYTISY